MNDMRKLMETVESAQSGKAIKESSEIGEIEGHLSDMLNKFQDYYGLEHLSADETYHDMVGPESFHDTEKQRQWLLAFGELWDATIGLTEE